MIYLIVVVRHSGLRHPSKGGGRGRRDPPTPAKPRAFPTNTGSPETLYPFVSAQLQTLNGCALLLELL